MTEIPKRVSLVTQTADILRREIQSGIWKEELPGEFALTKRLHVGRATIRGALEQLQREGWLEVAKGKHRRIVRRTGPRRAREHTGVVALLSRAHPEELSQFRLFLMGELFGSLQNAGCRLELHPNSRITADFPPRSLRREIARTRADCWVLFGPNPAVQRCFLDAGIPCVGVGAAPDETHIPYLRVDAQAAARHAVGTLLARGHRRIALLIGQKRAVKQQHVRDGFLEGFARSARPGGAEPIILTAEGSMENLQSLLRAQFRARRRPDAIITSHTPVVLMTMSYLMHIGLHLPTDLSLISLSHEPVLDSLTPSVAHYAVNWSAFARRLTGLVLKLVQTGHLPVREILVTPKFHPGGTLGLRSN